MVKLIKLHFCCGNIAVIDHPSAPYILELTKRCSNITWVFKGTLKQDYSEKICKTAENFHSYGKRAVLDND